MSNIKFEVNGIAVDVANDILPVWLMEVYLFRMDQSRSLVHTNIK